MNCPVTASLNAHMRLLDRQDTRAEAITAAAEALYEAALRNPAAWQEAHAESQLTADEAAALIEGDTAEAGVLADKRMRDWIWRDCEQQATRDYDKRRNVA